MNLSRAYLLCLMLSSLLGAWYGRGSFRGELLSLIVLTWVGAPLLFGAMIYALYTRSREGWNSLKPFFWIGISMLAIIASWNAGEWLHKHDVHTAKAFPAIALPMIREFQKTHPNLPDELDQIPNIPPVPALLTSTKANNQYTFTMYIEGAFMGHYESYNESDSAWEYAGD